MRGNCSAHSAQTTKQKSGSETSTLSSNGGTCFPAKHFYDRKKGVLGCRQTTSSFRFTLPQYNKRNDSKML